MATNKKKDNGKEDKFETAKNKEFDKLTKAIGEINDPILMLLRFHLYTEYLLERFLICFMRRGDKLIDNGKLSYHQKLILISLIFTNNKN